MKAIIILITAYIIGSVTPNTHVLKNFENCDAELTVEKDINSKQACENGTKFTLTLKNTSPNTNTYALSAINLENPCDNKSNASGIYVPLKTSIRLDNPDASQNEITVLSGQSIDVLIKVFMPGNVSNGDWGCVKIEAKPKGCSLSNVTTVLSVFVPNS